MTRSHPLGQKLNDLIEYAGTVLVSSVFICCLCVLMILSLPVTSSGHQAGSASIHGTVMDPTGSVVVGAEARLVGSGFAIRTRTSATDGTFVFEQVSPGPYVLRVTAPGFASWVQDVSVEASGIALTVPLQISSLSESVAVVGTAPLSASKNETTLGRLNGAAQVATAWLWSRYGHRINLSRFLQVRLLGGAQMRLGARAAVASVKPH